MTTREKVIDHGGNVSYIIRDGDQILGVVAKLASRYHAVNRGGGWAPAKSIADGERILALWKRLAS